MELGEQIIADDTEVQIFDGSGEFLGTGKVLSRRRLTPFNAKAQNSVYEYYVRGTNFGLWYPAAKIRIGGN